MEKRCTPHIVQDYGSYSGVKEEQKNKYHYTSAEDHSGSKNKEPQGLVKPDDLKALTELCNDPGHVQLFKSSLEILVLGHPHLQEELQHIHTFFCE